jgi:hypothetical protein
VYLNDEEVGRTPCQTSFTYYGTYDVRLVLDGFEPHIGPAEAAMPLYDVPPIDLVAEISPVQHHSVVEWHFDLMPILENPAAMLDRAHQLRAKLGPMPGAEPAQPADADVTDATDAEDDTTVSPEESEDDSADDSTDSPPSENSDG